MADGLSKTKIAYARTDVFLESSEFLAKRAPLPSPSTTRFITVQRGSSRDNLKVAGDTFLSELVWQGNNIVVVTPAEGDIQGEMDISTACNSAGDKFEVPVSRSADSSIKQGFQLEGINFEIECGYLVMIVGKVGAGKSSLVNAILGEMPRTSGILDIRGRVAYVSRDTCIRNATLRDNILFEQDYDAERYAQVLDVSQLTMDLKALPNGDSTEIGERGINLSGGQKARVAIARSMYTTRLTNLWRTLRMPVKD